jgi:hypothetical protein
MKFRPFPHKMSHQSGISRALRASASCLRSLLLVNVVRRHHPGIVDLFMCANLSSIQRRRSTWLTTSVLRLIFGLIYYQITLSLYFAHGISRASLCRTHAIVGSAPIPSVGHRRCKNDFSIHHISSHNSGLIPYLAALVVLIHIRVYKKIADA